MTTATKRKVKKSTKVVQKVLKPKSNEIKKALLTKVAKRPTIEEFVNNFVRNTPHLKVQYKKIRRNGQNKRKATVLAFPKDGKIFYGWSMCNFKVDENGHQDEFSEVRGIADAYNRAKHYVSLDEIPHSLRATFVAFQDRVNRYFKV